MPSIIVLCVLALSYWLDASSARGQTKAAQTVSHIDLEISGDHASDEACLTVAQLSARVVYYSSLSARPRGLRLKLYLTGGDTAELQVERDGAVVARRTFSQLPAACVDRRDAVALSIALALERVSAVPAAAKAQPSSQPTAAPPTARLTTSVTSAPASQAQTAEPAAAVESGEPTPPPPPEPEPEAAVPEAPTTTQQPASPEPDPEPAAPIVLDSLPTTTSQDPRRPRQSPLQLHLGGRFTLEAVPMPVWAGALGIELPLSKSLSLGFSALVSSVGETELAGARARASFMGLEAVGCGSIPLGIFMLQACGGAAVALCEVSGRDYPRARPDATLLWAAVLGRVALRWPRDSSFALRLLLQPHVSVSRPELRVEDAPQRLRTSWVGGTTGLEVWWAMP